MNDYLVFIFWVSVVSILLITACCTPQPTAEQKARTYCGSCHVFPEPRLLDKHTWEKSVLPQMAVMLGLKKAPLDLGDWTPSSEEAAKRIRRSLPSTSMVSEGDWNDIVAFYVASSPDSIVVGFPSDIDTLEAFHVYPIEVMADASVTLVKIDSKENVTFVGNRAGDLFRLDKKLLKADSIQFSSAPVDVIIEDQLYVCEIGVMDPNDRDEGRIQSVSDQFEPILDSLRRPVMFDAHDMDGDGVKELIVCEFGNYTGSLSVFSKIGNEYFRHLISESPGVRNVVIRDFNSDGKPDIMALVTQGNERLSLFMNEGGFHFSENVVLQFPPVYGSSYFELVDFNSDGYPDILYTNGDNADFSPITKPYHAVRVFLNNGKNIFSEVWHYSMPGVSKALARDFDGDGDLDIAAISFFPDFVFFKQGGFFYFENSGDGTFVVKRTPLSLSGRWLCMDAGDFDGDGDEDLILGAYNHDPSGKFSERWRLSKTTLLVFENILN